LQSINSDSEPHPPHRQVGFVFWRELATQDPGDVISAGVCHFRDEGNDEKMQLVVNGRNESFPADVLTVTELLQLAKVESPEMVSVQLNEEFIARAQYQTTQLKENDVVDFLYFMGGGGQ
jgi:sulfur carrier protein